MVATSIPAAINRAHIFLSEGASIQVARQFVGAAVIDVSCFAILVGIAIAYAGKPAIHRRLVAIATLVTVGAAFNR